MVLSWIYSLGEKLQVAEGDKLPRGPGGGGGGVGAGGHAPPPPPPRKFFVMNMH